MTILIKAVGKRLSIVILVKRLTLVKADHEYRKGYLQESIIYYGYHFRKIPEGIYCVLCVFINLFSV